MVGASSVRAQRGHQGEGAGSLDWGGRKKVVGFYAKEQSVFADKFLRHVTEW